MKPLKYNNDCVEEVKPTIYEAYIKDITIEKATQIFDKFSFENGKFKEIKTYKGIVNTLETEDCGGVSIFNLTQYDSNVTEDRELQAIEELRKGGRTQERTGEIIGKSQSYVSKKEKNKLN